MLERIRGSDARNRRGHREGDLAVGLQAVGGHVHALGRSEHDGVLRVDVDVVEPLAIAIGGVRGVVREGNRHEEGSGLRLDSAGSTRLAHEVGRDREAADRRVALGVGRTAGRAAVEGVGAERRAGVVGAAGVGRNLLVLEPIPSGLGGQIQVGDLVRGEDHVGDARAARRRLTIRSAVSALGARFMLVNEERAGSARIDVAEIGSPGGGRRTTQADKGESERSNGGSDPAPEGASSRIHCCDCPFIVHDRVMRMLGIAVMGTRSEGKRSPGDGASPGCRAHDREPESGSRSGSRVCPY